MDAVLFPGQGSQYVGMGSDFYKKFDLVKKIFKDVDETLGFSLSNIILNGPEEELKLTQNTQPAIMTVGVSIFKVLNQEYNFNLNKAKFFAGHSLGEYTALVCGGSLTIETATYLLHERGKSMQEAVPAGEGSMLAVLGMKIKDVPSFWMDNDFEYWTELGELWEGTEGDFTQLIPGSENIPVAKWECKYCEYKDIFCEGIK